MSDAPAAAKPATPKKKAAAKPKKPATHPVYSDMIKGAISSLKEKGGSSRQAILKYILKTYNVGTEEKKINAHLKMALKSGVAKGTLKQSKGTGAAGSFRLGDAKAEKPKKATKPKAAKKPAAKKTPKKTAAKKTGAKATPKAKKPAAKKAKTPKKAAAKKPAAKKAAKPAKKATPKKKPAAKKPAKKAAAKK